MEDLSQAAPEAEFALYAPADMSLETIREDAKQRMGLDIHLKMRIGPPAIDGNVVTFPVEAIDDEFLEGTGTIRMPGVGEVAYIGYFKEMAVPAHT